MTDLAGPAGNVTFHRERQWGHGTFRGHRHTIALEFVGGAKVTAAEAFIVAFPAHEFGLADVLVAEAAVVHVDRDLRPAPSTLVTICILTLETA
ncbi:hypothetical protein [Novosphingobium clariflavum]|uniref:Uncharacterized protein n=1 Tax=Novosphingobium clariflavum TaxID=2029884 RepID=A0ABV6S2M2_9SPHN|nr:hypothetical protein [Novosphingobium clariflavum]